MPDGKVLSGPKVAGRSLSHLLPFALAVVVILTCFGQPLIALAVHAANSELHSYILLVPFVSLYLFYIRREQITKSYSYSAGWASVAFALAFVFLMLALSRRSELGANDFLGMMMLSFLTFLAAAGFGFVGCKWVRSAGFPLAFLIFLIPMPDAMSDALERGSKFLSAEVAALFLSMSGTPVFRDGTIFQLPNMSIEVTEACSGIRSSWVLFITSLLVANLFLKRNWRRAVLVGFVIPLGVIRNGFRVFVIGMLCAYVDPDMINSMIHRRGGPLFFALSLIPLSLALWWLRSGETKHRVFVEGSNPGG
jgi:exosortase C (VPDSG-CTERM-specific)